MTAEMFKLFPNTPKFVHHSKTSHDAAISVLPVHRTLQEIVLAAITAAPMGLTDEQIVDVTGLAPNTARPRRVELAQELRDKHGNLVRPALIEQVGTRATKSGRQAAVWTDKK